MNPFDPSKLAGNTYRIPCLEGDVSFTVEEIAPNAKGNMDVWFRANESQCQVTRDMTYTGDHLKEMGFEIPPWDFNHVSDGDTGRGQPVASDPFMSAMAESVVGSLLDDDAPLGGERRIDWEERLQKLRQKLS